MELADGDIALRPVRVRDHRAWREVNQRNRAWLSPWEATIPPAPPGHLPAGRPSFRQMVRNLRAEASAGRMLPFAVFYRGRLAGQLTVAGITWGSMCSGHIGYWVDQAVAGRGVTPTAVALAVDHCFRTVGLHRIEICIRPENAPSRRVVEKLGFREEGLRPRYLHIDGDWRDHLVYALTSEEVPEGLLARWHSLRYDRPGESDRGARSETEVRPHRDDRPDRPGPAREMR